MDFSVTYSAQTEGSNPGAMRICLAQGHRGEKVADSSEDRTRDLPVWKPACLTTRPPALPNMHQNLTKCAPHPPQHQILDPSLVPCQTHNMQWKHASWKQLLFIYTRARVAEWLSAGFRTGRSRVWSLVESATFFPRCPWAKQILLAPGFDPSVCALYATEKSIRPQLS